MALWKDNISAKPTPSPMTPEPARFDKAEPPFAQSSPSPSPTAAPIPARAAPRELKESLIAADLTIEGKIQGTGHIRIAGQFKGDVNVEGDLTVEKGAKLTGGVRASKVTIAGELEGNIDGAQRVELLESGVLNGDLKAGSLTVAAGSRMRGQVEFGWEDKATAPKSVNRTDSGNMETSKMENGAAS